MLALADLHGRLQRKGGGETLQAKLRLRRGVDETRNAWKTPVPSETKVSEAIAGAPIGSTIKKWCPVGRLPLPPKHDVTPTPRAQSGKSRSVWRRTNDGLNQLLRMTGRLIESVEEFGFQQRMGHGRRSISWTNLRSREVAWGAAVRGGRFPRGNCSQ